MAVAVAEVLAVAVAVAAAVAVVALLASCPDILARPAGHRDEHDPDLLSGHISDAPDGSHF